MLDRGLTGAEARSRLAVALGLIAAGVVWAVARGVTFYGLTPARFYFDFDQPPVLLVIVGAWMLYRSRRR